MEARLENGKAILILDLAELAMWSNWSEGDLLSLREEIGELASDIALWCPNGLHLFASVEEANTCECVFNRVTTGVDDGYAWADWGVGHMWVPPSRAYLIDGCSGAHIAISSLPQTVWAQILDQLKASS